MRLIGLAVLIFCLPAACQRADQPPPPVPQPGPSAEAPVKPDPRHVSSLAGEWRVAGIDGASFDEPVGLALSGDATQIWWQPRCAGMARIYRIDDASISFTSADPPRKPGEPTPPVCAIGLPPRLPELFHALDAATRIERTPANGILISGGGRSVTLFSQ